MNQLWHLFRHDLRASHYILAVWFGSLALYGSLALRDPLTTDWTIYGSAIGVLTTVVAIVCSAILVQQDSLVGTQAFWMTRPISRWALLADKALYVGVIFVGSHLALSAAILLRFGLPLSEFPTVVAEGSWQWTAFLAAGVAIATMTTGAAQFVTVGLAAYVGITLAVIGVSVAARAGHTLVFPFNLACLVTLATCGAAIAMRYGGVSRAKAAAVLVAGGLAILVLTGARPFPATPPGEGGETRASEARWTLAAKEGAEVRSGDDVLRIESVSADVFKATVVVRNRRILHSSRPASDPPLELIHRASGARFQQTGSTFSARQMIGVLGGWPSLETAERTLEFRWDQQPSEIAKLGPAALDEAELIAHRLRTRP